LVILPLLNDSTVWKTIEVGVFAMDETIQRLFCYKRVTFLKAGKIAGLEVKNESLDRRVGDRS
jgi:hypothetical protein